MNMMPSVIHRVLLGVAFCSLVGSVQAAQTAAQTAAQAAAQTTAKPTAEAGACSVKSRSERVAIVVCPPGSKQDMLRAAGTAACKGQTGTCNAWIWDNAAKAPAKAPAIDTDMPKSVTGAARAVWINDSQSLMELRKAP